MYTRRWILLLPSSYVNCHEREFTKASIYTNQEHLPAMNTACNYWCNSNQHQSNNSFHLSKTNPDFSYTFDYNFELSDLLVKFFL